MPSEVCAAATANLLGEDAQNDLVNLVGHASLHAGGESTFQSTLDESWQTLTESLVERDCEVPEEKDLPKAPPSFCRAAGMCLCTPFGRTVRSFRDGLCIDVVKPWAKPHSPERDLLKGGRVCIALHGTKEIAPPEGHVGPPFVATLDWYFNFAYHVLSPWKSCFAQLQLGEAPAGEPPAGGGRVYLQAAYL